MLSHFIWDKLNLLIMLQRKITFNVPDSKGRSAAKSAVDPKLPMFQVYPHCDAPISPYNADIGNASSSSDLKLVKCQKKRAYKPAIWCHRSKILILRKPSSQAEARPLGMCALLMCQRHARKARCNPAAVRKALRCVQLRGSQHFPWRLIQQLQPPACSILHCA